jgi:hypothetical protein
VETSKGEGLGTIDEETRVALSNISTIIVLLEKAFANVTMKQ